MHCYLKLMIQELFSMTYSFRKVNHLDVTTNTSYTYHITHEKKANENSMISKQK